MPILRAASWNVDIFAEASTKSFMDSMVEDESLNIDLESLYFSLKPPPKTCLSFFEKCPPLIPKERVFDPERCQLVFPEESES